MAKAVLVALFFVWLITVTVASSITWIVLGNRHKNDTCTVFAAVPNLATYLIVTGVMGIGSFALHCVLLVLICTKRELSGIHKTIFCTSCTSWILMTVSWAILGEYRIVTEQQCLYDNVTMHNAAVIANVLSYFGIILTVALSRHVMKNDMNNEIK